MKCWGASRAFPIASTAPGFASRTARRGEPRFRDKRNGSPSRGRQAKRADESEISEASLVMRVLEEAPTLSAKVAVIIPAAGAGTRMGGRMPKQFLRLTTAPILALTVGRFARHPAVGAIVVVAPATHTRRAERLLRPLGRRVSILVVPGGQERQDSVRRGLEAVAEDATIVVVHDAVRPFVTATLITAVIEAARRDGAAICALPIAETVKRVAGGHVDATVDRAGLWSVQTPQAFHAPLLREAHDKALRDNFRGTDEAMLVERLGHPVRVVRGLPENIKITTRTDLRRARATATRRLR